MSITYPPEMLPQAGDEAAQVVVCSNSECCLKSEVERLRAALKKIAEIHGGDDLSPEGAECDMRRIAELALGVDEQRVGPK